MNAYDQDSQLPWRLYSKSDFFYPDPISHSNPLI